MFHKSKDFWLFLSKISWPFWFMTTLLAIWVRRSHILFESVTLCDRMSAIWRENVQVWISYLHTYRTTRCCSGELRYFTYFHHRLNQIIETVIFIHFSMHGCPLRLGPYLGGKGMYQKSENMWSFQMTPSNYRYVIFMWAKCLHRETAWQKTRI